MDYVSIRLEALKLAVAAVGSGNHKRVIEVANEFIALIMGEKMKR